MTTPIHLPLSSSYPFIFFPCGKILFHPAPTPADQIAYCGSNAVLFDFFPKKIGVKHTDATFVDRPLSDFFNFFFWPNFGCTSFHVAYLESNQIPSKLFCNLRRCDLRIRSPFLYPIHLIIYGSAKFFSTPLLPP